MKYKQNIKNLISIFLLFTIIPFSCINAVQKQTSISENKSDTTPTHFQKFKFSIQEIKSETTDNKYHCFIRFLESDKSYFLFETTKEYETDSLKHLFDSYYAFPYFTGGNYCRAIGINIIKVKDDTALFLGSVSGYDDIDGNGTKELYVDVVVESNGVHVDDVVEKFEVILKNDSLVYQEIDLY